MHVTTVVHHFGTVSGHILLDVMLLLPTTTVARVAKYAFLRTDLGRNHYILLQHSLVTLLQIFLSEI
jgi:hypothetical protein